MRKVKFLTIVLATVVLSACLIGCGEITTTSGENTTRPHISEEERESAQSSKDKWNQNRIEYEPTPSPTATPLPTATPTPSPTPTNTPTPTPIPVTCENKLYPESVKYGKSFTLGGTLTSINTMTEIRGQFIDENGNIVQEYVETPNSKTFEIKHSEIDHNLKFGELEHGKYTCVIKVKDDKNLETVVMKFDFTICEKTVTGGPKPTATPKPTNTSTPKPTATPKPTNGLSKSDQEIANKMLNATYPENCKVVAESRKSNDAGYEQYVITSKYDGKAVSIIQEYYDDEIDSIEAFDFYIKDTGSGIVSYTFTDEDGWVGTKVTNKALTPIGSNTMINISPATYTENTKGGNVYLTKNSSEYILSYVGLVDKNDQSITKDVTVVCDKNYSIKSVEVTITTTEESFRGIYGYTEDISVEVFDKNKTSVIIPEEILGQ